ncbi:MAG: hypothetical protein OXF21_06445, partial [bacterium]|nr:hypothetical protein [bacterium]
DEPTVVSMATVSGTDALIEGSATSSTTLEVSLAGGRNLVGSEGLTIPLDLLSDTGVVFTPADVAHVVLEPESNDWKTDAGFLASSSRPSFIVAGDDAASIQFTVEPLAIFFDGAAATEIYTIRLGGGAGVELPSENLEGGAYVNMDPAKAAQRFVLLDDESTLGVFADPASLQLDEGQRATFGVRLTRLPGRNRTVTVAPSSSAPAGALRVVSGASLSFSNDTSKANAWFKPQQVTVEALQDTNAYDAAFNLEAKLDGAIAPRLSIPVEIVDDDQASGVLKPDNDKRVFATSDFTRSGSSGPWGLTLNLSLGGDYVFAGATQGGFERSTNQGACSSNGGPSQPCRRLTAAAQGPNGSIDLVGAPDTLTLPANNGLRVAGTSGGTQGMVRLQLPAAATAALPAEQSYEMTLRVGGTLIAGEKNRFGETADGTNELCMSALSLASSGRCPPAEFSFVVYPDGLSTPANAEFVDVEFFPPAENVDYSASGTKVAVVTAVDFNDDAITYSLKSGHPADFKVADSKVGEVTYNGTGLNREDYTDGEIELTVIATSTGSNGSATGVEQVIKLPVRDADEGDATVTLTRDSVGRVNTVMKVATVSGDPDGDPEAGAIAYQWQRRVSGTSNWADITGNGANTSTYTVTEDDITPIGQTFVGHSLRVQVSYTDGGGNAEVVHSLEMQASKLAWIGPRVRVSDANTTEGDSSDPAKVTVEVRGGKNTNRTGAARLTQSLRLVGNETLEAILNVRTTTPGLSVNLKVGEDFSDPTTEYTVSIDSSVVGASWRMVGDYRVGVTFTAEPGKPTPTSVDLDVIFRDDDDAQGATYDLFLDGDWQLGCGSFCMGTPRYHSLVESDAKQIIATDSGDPDKVVDFAAAQAELDEGTGSANRLTVALDVSDKSAGSVDVTLRGREAK